MAGVNTCHIIGYAGGEPEMRYTRDGKPVTTISVGVSDRKDGPTTWFRVSAFDKLAEIVNELVTKGAQLYVSGPVRLDQWTGQGGAAHNRLALTARTVRMLDRKPTSGEPGKATGMPWERPANEEELDEIPLRNWTKSRSSGAFGPQPSDVARSLLY